MMRILIVDDEPSASNILKILLERHVAVPKEIVVCHSAEEAFDLIETFQPSLLMLDIEMPHLNGFDLLNRIPRWNFDVIFTTAYDRYAIKAIRFSALDYLLKPIDIIDLQNAMHRHYIKYFHKNEVSNELIQNLVDNLQQKDPHAFKLALRTNDGAHFYSVKDIVRCEGDNNYTHFYFLQARPLIVSHTLKDFEEMLTDQGFLRVHKSHLVNMRYVERLDKDNLIWLQDGSSVTVSRRRKKEVLDILSVRQLKP